ncbi:MAG: hypothetical protein NTX13_24790 [Acidobacteria bacterium]|nr:hypothetical protein [Acidobacteriota bacterium]
MQRRLFLHALLGASLPAQDLSLTGPVLGYLLTGGRHLHPLIGPAGSAYLAPSLKDSSALRQWAGSYGLDADGQLLFGRGTQPLRPVVSEGGWEQLLGSPSPDVALVRRGSRVAIARDGLAAAPVDLGLPAGQWAVSAQADAIAAADPERIALWRPDGALLFQTPAQDVRALALLPGAAIAAALPDGLLLADAAGRRELLPTGPATALALTGDASTLALLDPAGPKLILISLARREWREEKTPLAPSHLSPLRDGRSVLLTGNPAEPAWTLTVDGAELTWSQIPLPQESQN